VVLLLPSSKSKALGQKIQEELGQWAQTYQGSDVNSLINLHEPSILLEFNEKDKNWRIEEIARAVYEFGHVA